MVDMTTGKTGISLEMVKNIPEKPKTKMAKCTL